MQQQRMTLATICAIAGVVACTNATATDASAREAVPQSVICQGLPVNPTSVDQRAMPNHTRTASEYSISNKKKIYIASYGSRIYGDKGVTFKIESGISHTISGSITGTAEWEAGALFAKASASLSVTIGGSVTTSKNHGGSWKVTQSVGWLEVGTLNGYSFNWTKYYYKAPCTKVIQGKGTAKAAVKGAPAYYKHS